MEKQGASSRGAWLRAIGLYRGFWLVSLIPLSAGAALAWYNGAALDPWALLLTVLGVWGLHAGANLFNDYCDHVNGTDDLNRVLTPFSGGTRVIQEGLLDAAAIRRAALGCEALGATLLLICAAVTGRPWVLAWVPVGVLGGLFYSGAGLWLAGRGLGELTLGLVFGPALVSLGCYAQAGAIAPAAWLAGALFGLGATAVLTINEFPDLEADAAAGKRTLVVRAGRKRGFAIYVALLALMPLCLILGATTGLFPKASLLALLTLPLAGRLAIAGERRLLELPRQIAASRNTIVLHVCTWALFLAGIGLSRLW